MQMNIQNAFGRPGWEAEELQPADVQPLQWRVKRDALALRYNKGLIVVSVFKKQFSLVCTLRSCEEGSTQR